MTVKNAGGVLMSEQNHIIQQNTKDTLTVQDTTVDETAAGSTEAVDAAGVTGNTEVSDITGAVGAKENDETTESAEMTETPEHSDDDADDYAYEDDIKIEIDPEEKRRRYVDMTVNAGVPPLEARFSQINSCYRKRPVAYRMFTYINSVIEGVIPPEKYSYAAEQGESGLRLAKWNITEAIRAVRKFESYGRHVDFVTARCPAHLAVAEDLYGFVKEILDEEDFHSPEKICLEFPRTILYEDEEKVRLSVLSMKLLKVRTMMTGCGEKDCPVTSLINIPVDSVVLAPWLTVLSDDRNKGQIINAFIGFLKSLQMDVICDGIYNDEQINILNRADCYGYIPSSGYEGSVEHGRLRMPLDEALIQKEDDDG